MRSDEKRSTNSGNYTPKIECLVGTLLPQDRGIGGEWGAGMYIQYHKQAPPGDLGTSDGRSSQVTKGLSNDPRTDSH